LPSTAIRGNVTTVKRCSQDTGKMSQIVSCIDVLNEETNWRSRQDLIGWLDTAFGRPVKPSDKAVEGFERALEQMRRAVDELHFGRPVDWGWLDEALAGIRLTVARDSSRQILPLLHARVTGADDSALLQSLTETLLVQFAAFVSTSLQDKGATSIARCVGLFREGNNARLSVVRSIPEESELRWRAEIDVLSDHELIESPSVQRCADIFLAAPKAKFCSDACRFTTFQVAKQLKDPRYHADKQKRYRDKQTDTK
jgi:hypothetical protein